MTASEIESPFVPAGITLLVRMKSRALLNQLRLGVEEAPIKVFATALFVALIWFALFKLFEGVFEHFQTTLLQSAVAIPLIFNFFFVALLVLLTISNAVLAYGSLFAHEEAAYLLSSPLATHSTVGIKYVESLFFSSWSLLLLGFPLMMAIARVQNETWVFYPMFVMLFLAFVPIPGAFGLVLAWCIARFLPRTLKRVLVWAAACGLIFTIVWGLRSVRAFYMLTDDWLNGFFARMSLVEAAILPSTWVARGIEATINDQHGDALLYLAVIAANALFLSWLAILLVSRSLALAYDRAATTRGLLGRPAARASGGACGNVFFFLPHAARLIAAKDARTFFRDPMQWSQLAILFGLMILYLANMPRFDIDQTESTWVSIVPFLNLTAISFILATFTSRFVFPLVSLEGHQLWLIGLLPISRAWILIAKFSFAFLVTFSMAACVMLLASYILGLTTISTIAHLTVTASVCYGLCGFAVGIGARLPMFSQRNPARIANGLGGTINLIASVILVSVMLVGMGYATLKYGYGTEGLTQTGGTTGPAILCGAVVLLGIISGTVALIIGARHLARLEV